MWATPEDPNRMPKPRLIDVAREAGVSIGAASDALSGKNRIPEETRQRVRDAAKRLGYYPAATRTLPADRLPVIGLSISTFRRPTELAVRRGYWSDVVGAASLAAADRGYALAVLPGIAGTPFAKLPVAGLIVLDTLPDDPDLDRALDVGVPVMTDAAHERATILLDLGYDETVATAMDHLLERGARAPALIWSDVPATVPQTIAAAYADWCRRAKVKPRTADADLDGGGPEAAIGRLLDAGADAIYATVPASEAILAAAGARSLVLGRDLLVAALDEDPDGSLARLGITTVSFSMRTFTADVIATLVDVIEGRLGGPLQLAGEHRLTPRQSTRGKPGIAPPSGPLRPPRVVASPNPRR